FHQRHESLSAAEQNAAERVVCKPVANPARHARSLSVETPWRDLQQCLARYAVDVAGTLKAPGALGIEAGGQYGRHQQSRTEVRDTAAISHGGPLVESPFSSVD